MVEPLEWTKLQIQVAPPDERSCGVIIEGARAIDGDRLHVRDHEGRTWTIPLGSGDDPDVAARRLLREKYGKTTHSISALTTPAAAITRARRRAVVGNEGVKRLPLKPAPTPARLSEVQQG